MNVVIGADHAGFPLKQSLLEVLRSEAQWRDVGTCDTSPVDYPDIAGKVARAVLDGSAERGIVICGSGVGACIAANKFAGIRAGVCHDTYSARQGVEHDDMNVLVLGGRIVGTALAEELVRAFLRARFSGEDRHARRLEKIREFERQTASGPQ